MNILMVSPSYAPILGGTETCVRELSRAMRARGHLVDILTINMQVKWHPHWKSVVSTEDGGRVFRWAGVNPTSWMRTPWLNQLCRRHVDAFVATRLQRMTMTHVMLRRGIRRMTQEYDVVHCHDEADLTFPVALRPQFMHLHTMAETFPMYQRARLARHILRHASECWIANSQDSARRAIRLGIPLDRLSVVPNGVDPAVFTPGASPAPAGNLLFVGRLVQRKGLEVLLRALHQVRPPVTLRVVGDAPDATYGTSVRAMAAGLERATGHRVDFLGARSGQELVDLYRQAAIFVCPSTIEPFGIVALEAMNCAAAVVASRVDGLAEVVEDGRTGLLFRVGDEHDLASQLRRLVTDDRLRLRLGSQGREWASTRCTWAQAAETLEKVYRGEPAPGGARVQPLATGGRA